MSKEVATALVINGWTIYAHPLFLQQVQALREQVEALKKKDPDGCEKKNATKRLAAITTLAFDIIAQDPARPEYRQGGTLGDDYKHWFRAKFFQQYRLFFRYRADAKVIVFAWVNDEETKRACGSDGDVYKVFRRMLESGQPPDDWDSLLQAAQAESEQVKAIGLEPLAVRSTASGSPPPRSR
jgi:toxin YhaV